MRPDRSHPSFLELDRAALGQRAPGLEDHLGRCERCASHVRALQEPPPPPPAWVRAPPAAPSRWFAGWRLPAFAAAAAGLALLTFARIPDPAPANLITAKGSPAVGIYRKHHGDVTLWDGRTPIEPGDSLRLKVAPEGFGHLVVLSAANGPTAPLYQAPVEPGRALLLPVSWAVDSSPGPEQLTIVFSLRRLDERELSSVASQLPRNGEVWATQLILPKQGLPGESP